MNVLVTCEFSGIVRSAFAALGHNVWSCDLLPSEQPGQHIQKDAIEVSRMGCWDLMIAHPPCTFLANSGSKHLYIGKRKENGIDRERWACMEAGARFFRALLDAPVPRVAVENPIVHCHAREIIGQSATQVIQPWQYGHGETKATCLWLKSLPKLQPTRIVSGRTPRVHFASPGPDRWKERSRTLPGIATAMAAQWGSS